MLYTFKQKQDTITHVSLGYVVELEGREIMQVGNERIAELMTSTLNGECFQLLKRIEELEAILSEQATE